MRVVLDTNVLISGVFWKGVPGRILDAWLAGRFVLCASREILDEYFDVLDRIGQRLSRGDIASRWKACLFEHIEPVTAEPSGIRCRDPNDVMFMDCALGAGADVLVTGDQDLLSVQGTDFVRILCPSSFLKALDQRE